MQYFVIDIQYHSQTFNFLKVRNSLLATNAYVANIITAVAYKNLKFYQKLKHRKKSYRITPTVL